MNGTDAVSAAGRLPTVVFVAGYGRSGSTLLDMALSKRLGAAGTGEVRLVFGYGASQTPCSCGVPVCDCPIWGQVVTRALQRAGVDLAQANAVTVRTEAPAGCWRWLVRRHVASYRMLWREVFSGVADAYGAGVVIDSSKSSFRVALRFHALRKLAGLDVRVVHLVRDPRAVVRSVMRGSNRDLEGGNAMAQRGGTVRALLGWAGAHLAVHFLTRSGGCPVARTRYEDFVRDPEGEITRLSGLLGLPLPDQSPGAGLELDGGHGIGGNRLRRSGKITVREDRDWQDSLPFSARLLAGLTLPLAQRYGYEVATGTPTAARRSTAPTDSGTSLR